MLKDWIYNQKVPRPYTKIELLLTTSSKQQGKSTYNVQQPVQEAKSHPLQHSTPMASTSSITDSFPNFAPNFQLTTN